MKAYRGIHQILQHLCCLLVTRSSASLHFVVCMGTIFSAVCVLPVIFNRVMSKFNLCFKFCLEVIHQRLKFLCMPCSTDLGMLGQIIHYRKMRANLLWETWNTTMPILRDQIRVRTKFIVTQIIQEGVNCDCRLSFW